jgi:hypothetical protein
MKKTPEEITARATFKELIDTLNAKEITVVSDSGMVTYYPPGKLRIMLLEAPDRKRNDWTFVAFMCNAPKPTWNHVKNNSRQWEVTQSSGYKSADWPADLVLEVRDFVSGSYDKRM